MRNLIQDSQEKLYSDAKYETRQFVRCTLDDITYVTKFWNHDVEAIIVWQSEEEVTEQENALGSTEGMYLFYSDDSEDEVGIYLPGATEMYRKFLDAITQLHNDEYDLFYETIPNFVDVWYDGKNKITADFLCNIAEMPASAYTSAKIIANEMVQMLSDLKGPYKVEFYEGDDEGYIGFESSKKVNYYVGIRVVKI